MVGDNNNRRSNKEDHVHLYLSVPPKHSPAHVMKILKEKSAEYIRKEFSELSKKY
jgi:putative transposase